jgi:hypothetical protein
MFLTQENRKLEGPANGWLVVNTFAPTPSSIKTISKREKTFAGERR